MWVQGVLQKTVCGIKNTAIPITIYTFFTIVRG